jgi:hypothetical protein
MAGFYEKPAIFLLLRGRSAAVAIFKPKAWHPVAKHGSGKRQKSRADRACNLFSGSLKNQKFL